MIIKHSKHFNEIDQQNVVTSNLQDSINNC